MGMLNIDEIADWAEENMNWAEYGEVVVLHRYEPSLLYQSDRERITAEANTRAMARELAYYDGIVHTDDDEEILVVKGSPAWYHGVDMLMKITDNGFLDVSLIFELVEQEISDMVEQVLIGSDAAVTALSNIYAPTVLPQMLNQVYHFFLDFTGEIKIPSYVAQTLPKIESEMPYQDRPRTLGELSDVEREYAVRVYGIDPNETRKCVTAHMVLKAHGLDNNQTPAIN